MHIYRKKFEDTFSAQETAKSLLASYIDRPQPPQVGLEEEDGVVWLSVVLDGEIPDLEQLLQATGYAQID
jgi:hypothetical protein